MNQFEEERLQQRRHFQLNLLFITGAVVVAGLVALLLTLLLKRLPNRPPHCPNPKTFLESTVPTTR